MLLSFVPQEENVKFGGLIEKSRARVRISQRLQSETAQRVLYKTLSRTRKIATKTEQKTNQWIDQLQKRSKDKKREFSEDYWSQFKKKR